jgi:hypothetical protein
MNQPNRERRKLPFSTLSAQKAVAQAKQLIS